MCEFCHKHGEGEKWYLRAQNYSDDLLSDLKRRKFVEEFIGPGYFGRALKSLEKLHQLPSYIRAAITPIMLERQKKRHWGQVVPIEDIERIFGFVSSVVRLPCLCREATVSGKEQRYCYALSMVPFDQSRLLGIVRGVDKSYLNGPDTGGLENMTKDQALATLKELEKDGLCHTIWTFLSPFIGSICNCSKSDCIAMRAVLSLDYPMMFPAEYVAQVNPDLCKGCRQCMRVCQFGAIKHSDINKKAVIDQRKCYGCGICRASCPENAIKLDERSSVIPVARTR
jgi:ferredoxin